MRKTPGFVLQWSLLQCSWNSSTQPVVPMFARHWWTDRLLTAWLKPFDVWFTDPQHRLFRFMKSSRFREFHNPTNLRGVRVMWRSIQFAFVYFTFSRQVNQCFCSFLVYVADVKDRRYTEDLIFNLMPQSRRNKKLPACSGALVGLKPQPLLKIAQLQNMVLLSLTVILYIIL